MCSGNWRSWESFGGSSLNVRGRGGGGLVPRPRENGGDRETGREAELAREAQKSLTLN